MRLDLMLHLVGQLLSARAIADEGRLDFTEEEINYAIETAHKVMQAIDQRRAVNYDAELDRIARVLQGRKQDGD